MDFAAALTALFGFLDSLTRYETEVLKAMPEAERAAFGKLRLDDLKRWHEFADLFRPKV